MEKLEMSNGSHSGWKEFYGLVRELEQPEVGTEFEAEFKVGDIVTKGTVKVIERPNRVTYLFNEAINVSNGETFSVKLLREFK
jgi:hypothetical protein